MKLGPCHYKMVIKNKAGKTGGYDMKFAEHGMFLTAYVGHLTATGFYMYVVTWVDTKQTQRTSFSKGGCAILREPGRSNQELGLLATWMLADCLSR